jgi:uncharacterized protein (TIGR03435 family)
MERAAMGLGNATIAVLVLASAAATAQENPASPEPAFEVASVKPSPDDLAPEGISLQPDGSARFTRFQVRTLITIAYRSEGIQRFDQLVGAPAWIGADRFDIVGRAGAESGAQSGPGQLPAMLRSLLRDRFRLRVHSETRDVPAYRLVLARRDGKPGPGLRESTTECPGAGAAPANQDPNRWCGIRATGGVIIGRAVSPAQLAGNLAGYPAVDRFVTDGTGLMGRYDFRLEYSPAFLQSGDSGDTARPSLFTALTEQLGLRLQPETKTVPVLVIDNVEKPAPD